MPKKNIKPFLYLASQSARRKEILRKMGFRFRVVKSRYRETFPVSLSPRQIVLRHALGKIHHAPVRSGAGFLLGADTIVVCGGKIFGKPKTVQEAHAMIRCLSGRAHMVYTGVALRDLRKVRTLTRIAKTKVHFRKLTDGEICNYITKVNPLDKAGGYAIQEGPKIVRRIEGSYSNVVGLPTELLRKMIKRLENR